MEENNNGTPTKNSKKGLVLVLAIIVIALLAGAAYYFLGNAATPMGIKAMKSLQEKNNNKEIVTKDMMMFIILNTASIQIIPTTVIAIRGALFSRNPSEIILPVWIATIVSDLVGILAVKFFSRKNYERREIKWNL